MILKTQSEMIIIRTNITEINIIIPAVLFKFESSNDVTSVEKFLISGSIPLNRRFASWNKSLLKSKGMAWKNAFIQSLIE